VAIIATALLAFIPRMSQGGIVIILLCITCLVSAIAIYFLVLHFTHKRWGIEINRNSYISTATAILCNPAWLLFLMHL